MNYKNKHIKSSNETEIVVVALSDVLLITRVLRNAFGGFENTSQLAIWRLNMKSSIFMFQPQIKAFYGKAFFKAHVLLVKPTTRSFSFHNYFSFNALSSNNVLHLVSLLLSLSSHFLQHSLPDHSRDVRNLRSFNGKFLLLLSFSGHKPIVWPLADCLINEPSLSLSLTRSLHIKILSWACFFYSMNLLNRCRWCMKRSFSKKS